MPVAPAASTPSAKRQPGPPTAVATYAATRNTAPWERLTKRASPNVSVKPDARRNRSSPNDVPIASWRIHSSSDIRTPFRPADRSRSWRLGSSGDLGFDLVMQLAAVLDHLVEVGRGDRVAGRLVEAQLAPGGL